ncbi:Hypothetical predicted protein [Lecanosticta acicola]|uniref:Integral membrane protein n=1 Tax=Lecanosticta acicola TaxID=111012 RepID=A0AAI9ECY1_9PEZI|nr:Hypothetical predicted protein [Lecanosticta acicola]
MVTSANVEKHDSIDTVGTYGTTSFSVLEKLQSVAEIAQDKFRLRSVKATGPSRLFNPTNVRMRVEWTDEAHQQDPGADMTLLWRSRDSRKGRNSIAVPRAAAMHSSVQFPDGPPQFSASFTQICKGMAHIFTRFPYWDMAFWVAFCFTLGSVIYVFNGIFTWFPVAHPEMFSPEVCKMTEGLTAFFGVVFYEIGAVLAYLEAINAGTFHGSAMRRFLEGHQDEQKKLVDAKLQSFVSRVVSGLTRQRQDTAKVVDSDEMDAKQSPSKQQHQRRVSVWRGLAPRRYAMDLGVEEDSRDLCRFRWIPTWKNLKEYHIHEIGFLACSIQLLGATLFIIPGITLLPSIFESLEQWEQNAAYWIPDIVASTLFIVSSLLFMLETQDKWYKPQIGVVGWHIGFWAVVGSVGFDLAAVLGPASYTNHAVGYQLGLSCIWSSACFVISTLLQWYEAVNKNVIEELEPGSIARHIPHPI